MRRLLVIGIDALDADLVARFSDRLPNLKALRTASPDMHLVSIFPPDSPPAWASIYTGQSPARHGLINFVNPGAGTGEVKLTALDNSLLQDRTFWDIAGASGRRSCVLFPFPIYPAYQINGAMVCRTPKAAPRAFPLSSWPAGLAGEHGLSPAGLNLHFGFVPETRLASFARSCGQKTEAEASAARALLKSQTWDLFFVYHAFLDATQHAFWRHFDESHPDFVGPNRFQDIIPAAYAQLDTAVGRLVEEAGPDTAVMLLSDHGHGRRPTRQFNLNEVLRLEGLLTAKSSGKTARSRADSLKSLASSLVSRFGVGSAGMRMLARFPVWKKVFASSSGIDWENTRAYVSDLSAVKSYSYAGIIVRQRGSGSDYEAIRSRIIEVLGSLRKPDGTGPLAKWVARREDIYRGELLNKYPDVVFELDPEYSAGWSVNCPLVTPNPMYRMQPGGHRRDSAVLYMANTGRVANRTDSTLMDISPTILDLLGVKSPVADGNSLLE